MSDKAVWLKVRWYVSIAKLYRALFAVAGQAIVATWAAALWASIVSKLDHKYQSLCSELSVIR